MARGAPHHQYGRVSHWLRRQTARNRRLPLSRRFFADESIRNTIFPQKVQIQTFLKNRFLKRNVLRFKKKLEKNDDLILPSSTILVKFCDKFRSEITRVLHRNTEYQAAEFKSQF